MIPVFRQIWSKPLSDYSLHNTSTLSKDDVVIDGAWNAVLNRVYNGVAIQVRNKIKHETIS